MKQLGQYSTLNDASSCQLASVWKNTPTQCNSSIPRTRSWPWSTLYCAGVLYTCHLNICSPWIWTNKLDHSDTSKLHRVNSLTWIKTSYIGTKCWQTSIQHQSPNQTKPSAPHQDNQSIEISQTTHIYMHTHTHALIHGHCMVQKQTGLLNVKLYFSTNSCAIRESSRLKISM